MSPQWKVIPAKQQKPGALLGGFWVVLQAWPIANQWTLALLGPEGGKITAGYGGWETTAVPRDVGVTEWKGRPNYEMDLDLLYDGWITHPLRPTLQANQYGTPHLPHGVRWSRPGVPTPGGGVWLEGQLKELEDLAQRMEGDETPHSLRLYGALPHTEVRWVIQELTWGDTIRDKVTGRRMRQQVMVHLVEFNQPGDVAKLPRSAKPKPKPKPKKAAKPKPSPKKKK